MRRRFCSKARSASLVTLPQVIQISFGGEPNRPTNSTKSTSLLSKIAFAVFASAKMVLSSASRKPSSRNACASCAISVRNQCASCGGNCASSQSVATSKANYAASRTIWLRCAANCKLARMSSTSRSGKSSRICACDTPAASSSSTSLTRMRMPRMHGRPPHCSGLQVMRSKRLFCSVVIGEIIRSLSAILRGIRPTRPRATSALKNARGFPSWFVFLSCGSLRAVGRVRTRPMW